MADMLFDSSWLGPLLWAAVYISDYRMTLICARMYQAQQAIIFEGSYEITPLFQADVNALRRLSPRFVIALVAGTACLAVMQQTSSASGSLAFNHYRLAQRHLASMSTPAVSTRVDATAGQ